MFFEALFTGIALGGTAGMAWLRVIGARRSRALPMPGEPPKDRGEAVRRVLKHLQRRSIAELADGTAGVVQGLARSIPGVPLLRSPVMGIECIGYHLDIRATHLANGFHFPQLREEARCTAFDVTDETGVIRVTPEGLELAITDGPIGRWDPPFPPPIAALVPPQFQYWSVTVEEGVLLPNAPVLVCGVAMSELAATDYRDGVQLLALRATSTFPLVASTDADLFKATQRPILPEELRKPRPR
ncbi:hypothetical protein BH11MYX3_BH11MYX3_48210 [soil metagenome]